MKDNIIIKHPEVAILVTIEYEPEEGSPYYFIGEIISGVFPDIIKSLLIEQDELIDGCSLSLLVPVEEEIYAYGISLEKLNQPIFRIRLLGDTGISFFTKYPTSKGFVDNYPE
jgi:hypothetical protein